MLLQPATAYHTVERWVPETRWVCHVTDFLKTARYLQDYKGIKHVGKQTAKEDIRKSERCLKSVVEEMTQWETRQTIYVLRNIEARSCNHLSQWKSKKYYIFWACFCSIMYPAFKVHELYYRIFYNLIRILLAVSEGQKIKCGLESRAD